MLPNQSCLTINIKRNQQTSEVIDIVLQKLQIPIKLTKHFGIFETVENNFGKILVSILKKRQISVIYAFFFNLERKLSPDECPFAVYVANFSTASATCLCLKPFIFSMKLVEAMIQSDLKILDLMFFQVSFRLYFSKLTI